jgi:hypothetical protein
MEVGAYRIVSSALILFSGRRNKPHSVQIFLSTVAAMLNVFKHKLYFFYSYIPRRGLKICVNFVDCGLLGCNSMYSHIRLPHILRNLLPSFSLSFP